MPSKSLKVDDETLIRDTLRGILRSKSAPAQAKSQAARTLAELAGLLRRDPADLPGRGDVSQMTRAQLEALLAGEVNQNGASPEPEAKAG